MSARTIRLPLRILALGLTGALAGAACLAAVVVSSPRFVLDMNGSLPRLATGFHAVERDRTASFAWTGARADVRLRGLDRRLPWRCGVRLTGARAASLPQPLVRLAVDGITVASAVATNDYETIEAVAPPAPGRPGLQITISVTDTFVPGDGDLRSLGVRVDRVECVPEAPGWVRPPRAALAATTAAGAVAGVALALAGATVPAGAGALVILAAAQAIPLSSGPAPYSAYAAQAPWLMLWIAGVALLMRAGIQWWRGRPFHRLADLALALTVAAIYLKLLAGLHPDKALVDAVFHAHRLGSVLGGGFFFTQPMPDGVSFPYAIALYVFAAPWAGLTRDHVDLLRIVVTVSEGVAGGLLYLMVVRSWGERATGVLAVALFHVVPLPYVVIGNANLTNAFGQSAALVALVAATVWPLGGRRVLAAVALTTLIAVALLSHVSTFGLLLGVLLPLVILCWWIGGPALRAPAGTILLATAAAVVVSVLLYYGHFIDTYGTLAQVAPDSPGAGDPVAAGPDPAPTPLPRRALGALALTVRDIGWPVVVLGLAGAWRLVREQRRDRLALLIMACGVAYIAFVLVGLLTPMNVRFERYAAEFISRVNLAVYPAVVVLAASAAAHAWRARLPVRLAALALVAVAIGIGAESWSDWFR